MNPRFWLSAIALFTVTSALPAATITWNTLIADTSGLNPSGIFYQGAISSQWPSIISPVDKVIAIADDVEGGSTATFSGLVGDDITFAPGGSYFGGGGFNANGSGNGSAAPATGDTNLDNIIRRMDWQGGGGGFGNYTLTGLTPGKLYEVQLFSGDNRGCCFGRMISYGDGVNPQTASTSLATFPSIYGDFVADASGSQTIRIGNAGSHVYLSALVLYAVPEPSRAVLLGLGLGAMLLRRRR